jgi:hypothetical protein
VCKLDTLFVVCTRFIHYPIYIYISYYTSMLLLVSGGRG